MASCEHVCSSWPAQHFVDSPIRSECILVHPRHLSSSLLKSKLHLPRECLLAILHFSDRKLVICGDVSQVLTIKFTMVSFTECFWKVLKLKDEVSKKPVILKAVVVSLLHMAIHPSLTAKLVLASRCVPGCDSTLPFVCDIVSVRIPW